MEDNTKIKVIISGRVQGVFYRAHTKDEADRLDIKGYVKNLPNGCVEAVFQGQAKAVSQMTDWCRKGPGAARVDHVLAEKIKKLSEYKDFEIRY
ncbi:MAG: acylphosphatase [Deltaproteobacteria bacterium]|nr:acylphosphatase [Deltaproteobacteria bacterium]